MNINKITEIMNRNPRKILDKSECYLLYEAGIFGNKALTWKSYDEIIKSGWRDGVCMRSKKGVARKEVRYNLKLEEVPEHIRQFRELGIAENMIGFNQSMPDEKLIIQGEVMYHNGLFWLLYSNVKKPMNRALAEKSEEVNGRCAQKTLIRNMNFDSYADLEKLLETFPTSVVEFSTYSIPVGNRAITGRDTVFWEVRNY